MKLTNIAAINLKGQTFSESISPAQIFVGKNFAGKTTRTDAIQLALLGYLPNLGKNHKDTFSLSSGREMSVIATFDDGSQIARKWTLKGDSIRLESQVPPAFENPDRFEVALDAAKYFGLSDRARIEYVFGLVNLGQLWTRNAIEERLQEKITDKDGVMALLAEIPPSPNVQAFVEMAIEHCTGAQKQAKVSASRFEQTIQGLTELRVGDAPGLLIAQLEQQAQSLQAEMNGISQRRGEIITGYTAIRSARIRRAEIDREKSHGEKSRIELANAKQRLELLKQKRAEVFPPTELLSDDILVRIANLSAKQTQQNLDYRNMQSALDKVERAIQEVDEQQTCPYCGATGEGWKAIKLAELAQEVSRIEKDVFDLQTVTGITKNELDDAKRCQKAFAEYKAQLEVIDQDEAATMRTIARLEPQLARLGALDEERARLTPEDPELEAKVETLQTDLNVKAQDLRDIQVRIKACMGRQSELQRLAQAEEQRDEARIDEVTAKEMTAELRLIQSEMVQSSFAPLLARANAMFPGVMRGPLEYSSKTQEIGMMIDGLFVAHHTFSGSERALCYAAIQCALTSENPCRIMIIDELGRVDNDNLWKLIQCVKDAIARGELDGFIGIDVSREAGYKAREDSAFNCRVLA
jgi:hypothetical protein